MRRAVTLVLCTGWLVGCNIPPPPKEGAPPVLAAPTMEATQHEEIAPAPSPIAQTATTLAAPPPAPTDLIAAGADRRVDLRWGLDLRGDLVGYQVYRATAGADFVRVTARPHVRQAYSDFLGENGRTARYRVTSVFRNPDGSLRESAPTEERTATTRQMTDDELLTSVQEAAFRYFWDYGHPVSGLARERTADTVTNDCVTSGGSGFGLMNIVVGAARGFVTRAEAAGRVLTMLRFLEQADRFHGAWPHWLNGTTGRVLPFSEVDDGGDLVETSYLVQGLLTVRQYFQSSDPAETEIRALATRLWEGVEWSWYWRDGQSGHLTWHWSPRHGWKLNQQITGFNECMITYVLAVASPTHPAPPECYRRGWAGNPYYANGKDFFGHRLWVGPDLGGPLFFTHYSYLGLDPRGWHDGFCDYFENNRAISLIHQAYGAQNPGRHKGYSDTMWGLTASDNPWGYAAQAPGAADNGTISPTAALSAMPYTPDASRAALKAFYRELGPRLWGEFGFRDAFNLDQNWFAPSYLAIDQGTIAPMIENYRSQLCWRLFMANPEIEPALKKMGWVKNPAR